MTENNDLFTELQGEHFKMEIMVRQISKESPKKSEILPVSLQVAIQETQYNMKDRGRRNITVELKKTVIQQPHIPSQN